MEAQGESVMFKEATGTCWGTRRCILGADASSYHSASSLQLMRTRGRAGAGTALGARKDVLWEALRGVRKRYDL